VLTEGAIFDVPHGERTGARDRPLHEESEGDAPGDRLGRAREHDEKEQARNLCQRDLDEDNEEQVSASSGPFFLLLFSLLMRCFDVHDSAVRHVCSHQPLMQQDHLPKL